MTNEQAIAKLTAVLNDDIYSWSPAILTAFGMAVDALEKQDRRTKILADVLDGSPLTIPCNKLFEPDDLGWCAKHCKAQEPTTECWLKYVEVMTNG